MSKYVGITIGPIFKTLNLSRERGQLWGSSYIFSYIMKNIIEELKSQKVIKTLLVPYDSTESIDEVGIYPDRLIFEVDEQEETATKLEDIKVKVLKNLSKNITDALKNKYDIEKIEKFIFDYIQIYYVIKADVKKPISEINQGLDFLELHNQILPKSNENYLLEFLENENIKNSFLMKDANMKVDKFNHINGKYYAIVQSDGDGIGKIINSLGNDDVIKFSEKLFKYSKQSVKAIKEFGGIPIYAGGDDLLFFAPLKHEGKSLFVLIDEISKIFDDNISEKNTSLSFGTVIVYEKHPLYEALGEASSLLFNKAKDFKLENGKEKNSIACKLIKHSGQSMKFTLNKSTNTYNEFFKFVEGANASQENVKSIKNGLRVDSVLLEEVILRGQDIKYYFDNNFGKGFHEENKEYIKNIITLIEEYGIEYKDNNKIDLQEIAGMLEFKDFINGVVK